ncbi:MAG: hypothetical protein OKBPIBMD_01939 [Chlorobi bacterium]|nr:hypothetical protein [Chlorobiota bacterium]
MCACTRTRLIADAGVEVGADVDFGCADNFCYVLDDNITHCVLDNAARIQQTANNGVARWRTDGGELCSDCIDVGSSGNPKFIAAGIHKHHFTGTAKACKG